MQSSGKNIIRFSSIAMLVLVLPGLMLALSAAVGYEEPTQSVQSGSTLACAVQLMCLVCGVLGLVFCGRERFRAAVLFSAAGLTLAAMAATVVLLKASGVVIVPQLTALCVMIYGVYTGKKKTDK